MKNQDLNINKEYRYGFTTDIESIRAPKGLNENTIKFISNIKKEPKWITKFKRTELAKTKIS
jgi:Fe-S cluster assembly protein SufB